MSCSLTLYCEVNDSPWWVHPAADGDAGSCRWSDVGTFVMVDADPEDRCETRLTLTLTLTRTLTLTLVPTLTLSLTLTSNHTFTLILTCKHGRQAMGGGAPFVLADGLGAAG